MAQYQPPPLLIDIKNLTAKYLADALFNFAQWFNDHDSGVRSWNTVTTGTLNYTTAFQRSGLAAGPIIQIVSSSTSTPASSVGGAYVDSNLTGTITPKFSTSSIIVMVSQYVSININGGGTNLCKLKLLRGATSLVDTNVLGQSGVTPSLIEQMVSLHYYDSPATTSATTYKTQIGNNGTPGSTIANNNTGGPNSTAWMILVEVGF